MTQASTSRRALIVAGEASGDLHGANLIRAARDLDPGLSFFGVGGARMRAAGCEILIPAEELAVMGLVEVLGRLPVIRRAFARLRRVLQGPERPDLLILVDYPGFNLRLAKQARRAGVPVLYYICPKVWAWKPGRIPVIAANVDVLASIFPFEAALFAGTGLRVEYVGNPLLDDFAPPQPRAQFLTGLGLDPEGPVLGLFPGSRRSELKHSFATLLETARQLRARHPRLQLLLPVAASLQRSELEAQLADAGLPVTLVEEEIYTVAAACDAVLCVSGTVTLQVALAGTPMAVLYKAAPLTYAVGRLLVKIPHFSLVNIVAEREVVREFLQHQANPPALAAEIDRLLEDAYYRARVEAGLAEVRRRLGGPGSAERVAALAVQLSRQTKG